METALNIYSSLSRRLVSAAGRARHRLRIHDALDHLCSTSQPDEHVLRELARAWSGEGYEADIGFLMEVAHQGRRSERRVLECGSGLTTLVLAAYCTAPVTTLEQHGPSFHKVRRCLQYMGASHVAVLQRALRSHGEWDWYDWSPHPTDVIDLVVCDGPPGNTPGGRFGLMPVVRANLSPGATLLVDDVHRDQEARMVSRWTAEFGVVQVATLGDVREFAVLREGSAG